jgi:zinc D-Ala-D-Ala carboxypeptidase
MKISRAAFVGGLVATSAMTVALPARAAIDARAPRVLWLRRAGFGELRAAFTIDGVHYDFDAYRKFAAFLRDVETNGTIGPIGPLDPTLIDGFWEIQRYYRSIGIDEPIDVFSCFRTAATNAEVGGRTQSYHLVAKAADIAIAGVPMPHLHAVCEAIYIFGGVGSYVDHVHVDTGPAGRRW